MTTKFSVESFENLIVFEDESILIVNKPYDIPTSGRFLEDDDAVQYWLIQREGKMVWAVHQLDADTTGVVIFVKQKKIVGKYQKALSNPSSSKEYLAIVYGVPTWDYRECHEPIGKVDSRSLGVTPEGKESHSSFTVLNSCEEFSLIQCRIETGRTHQIRIHLSHLGHPLVGEEWYRNPPCAIHHRQLLHSYKTTLKGIVEASFVAPVPIDFRGMAEKLGLSLDGFELQ